MARALESDSSPVVQLNPQTNPHMAVPENPSIGGSPADEDRLEYRSSDEAWYDVDLSRDGDRLTIKYRSLSSTLDEVYEPCKFQTVGDVNAFRDRFRPSSLQAQDTECRKIVPGMKVCAYCCFDDNDLRYFDAFVQKVDHKEHSFENGEEQCSCSFALKWQNGPKAGMITTSSIESVCLLQDGPLDQILVDFIRMSRKAVVNSLKHSRLVPAPITHTADIEPSTLNGVNKLTLGQEVARYRQQITSQLKGNGSYTDKRAAGVPSNIQGRCHYIVAIENMEKDLSASTVLEFIHKETTISPEAHIFPSLKTDLFTRGILKVHSEREFRVLLGFLESPHHTVVSSHNRPWVVIEKFSGQDYKPLVSNIIPTMECCHNKGSDSELKVVNSGTDEYALAKKLKENHAEFYHHQKRVLKRLAFEEEKILQQSGKSRNRSGR